MTLDADTMASSLRPGDRVAVTPDAADFIDEMRAAVVVEAKDVAADVVLFTLEDGADELAEVPFGEIHAYYAREKFENTRDLAEMVAPDEEETDDAADDDEEEA